MRRGSDNRCSPTGTHSPLPPSLYLHPQDDDDKESGADDDDFEADDDKEEKDDDVFGGSGVRA